LVLRAIGALPQVEDEKRYGTLGNVAQEVVYLLAHQPLTERPPGSSAPASALDVARALIELVLEVGYRTEPLFDGLRQLPFRVGPAVWAHVAPEKRVQHVS